MWRRIFGNKRTSPPPSNQPQPIKVDATSAFEINLPNNVKSGDPMKHTLPNGMVLSFNAPQNAMAGMPIILNVSQQDLANHAAVMEAQKAQAQTSIVEVVVPDGKKGGDKIQVNTASGIMDVTIPPLLKAGDKFNMTVPTPVEAQVYLAKQATQAQALKQAQDQVQALKQTQAEAQAQQQQEQQQQLLQAQQLQQLLHQQQQAQGQGQTPADQQAAQQQAQQAQQLQQLLMQQQHLLNKEQQSLAFSSSHTSHPNGKDLTGDAPAEAPAAGPASSAPAKINSVTIEDTLNNPPTISIYEPLPILAGILAIGFLLTL